MLAYNQYVKLLWKSGFETIKLKVEPRMTKRDVAKLDLLEVVAPAMSI